MGQKYTLLTTGYLEENDNSSSGVQIVEVLKPPPNISEIRGQCYTAMSRSDVHSTPPNAQNT